MSKQTAYWTCQILGWGAFCLLGAGITSAYARWRVSVAAGYLLFFRYSIGLTHLLRREMHRRQWSSLAARRAWPRLLLAALFVASIQTACVVAVSVGLEGGLRSFAQPLPILPTWTNITFATTYWTMLYAAITSTRRYREARYEALQLQLALREAELKLLEAQLNLHFLFNCLNTVRGMIAEDPSRAQDMVTRLVNLLRYTLRGDRPATAPLSREVEIVNDYLALEAARFEERLAVRFEIDPHADNIAAPS